MVLLYLWLFFISFFCFLVMLGDFYDRRFILWGKSLSFLIFLLCLLQIKNKSSVSGLHDKGVPLWITIVVWLKATFMIPQINMQPETSNLFSGKMMSLTCNFDSLIHTNSLYAVLPSDFLFSFLFFLRSFF